MIKRSEFDGTTKQHELIFSDEEIDTNGASVGHGIFDGRVLNVDLPIPGKIEN
jgi:hypothetical protein